MVNKKLEEVTAASITSNTTVPENVRKIMTPEDIIGFNAEESLKNQGVQSLPESAIKFSKKISIDEYCFD